MIVNDPSVRCVRLNIFVKNEYKLSNRITGSIDSAF